MCTGDNTLNSEKHFASYLVWTGSFKINILKSKTSSPSHKKGAGLGVKCPVAHGNLIFKISRVLVADLDSDVRLSNLLFQPIRRLGPAKKFANKHMCRQGSNLGRCPLGSSLRVVRAPRQCALAHCTNNQSEQPKPKRLEPKITVHFLTQHVSNRNM